MVIDLAALDLIDDADDAAIVIAAAIEAFDGVFQVGLEVQ
jgi:hypothetical protein